MRTPVALTVSAFTRQVKALLEDTFEDISVIGEVSNFKAHNSGHWYFSLKDADAQITCVMWRSITSSVRFTPQDGMKVICSGRLTVYPPRGNYQLDARTIIPAGAGELQVAFEALKQKLGAEGLFSDEYKKPIPRMPMKIGIATAIDGAALQDMISVAKRRFPLTELALAPCRVQGAGAADSIAEALTLLNNNEDIEVIILARGGGSIEDLWAFNEEKTVRAIFASEIPVITGIGHETDFTIADFTADMRAPTPTAAMEFVTPDINAISGAVKEYVQDLETTIIKMISSFRAEIKRTLGYTLLRRPVHALQLKMQSLDYAASRFQDCMKNRMQKFRYRIELLDMAVKKHDTRNALKKGFVLVSQHGKFVKRGVELIENDSYDLQFFDSTVKVNSNEKE